MILITTTNDKKPAAGNRGGLFFIGARLCVLDVCSINQHHRNMEIRRARAKDAEEACAVVRRSISELCGADHRGDDLVLNSWLTNKTADSMRGWIARSHVFVAVDNDRIVGVGAMTRLGKMTLNYVAPEARFRGISKGIVLRLETQAASMGLGRVTLESTTTALRFYHSIGYRSDGPPTAAVGTALCHPLAKTL